MRLLHSRSAFVALRALVASLFTLIGTDALAAQSSRAISVRYVSSGAVYLDAGRTEGLEVGARVRVFHEDSEVAELEVEYVAEHSASCRVVRASGTVQPGDSVVILPTPQQEEVAEPVAPPAPQAREPAPRPYEPRSREPERPQMRASGSVTFSYRSLAADAGPSVDESGGRLSLRLRDIGGRPLTLRVRARSRQIQRDGVGASVPTSQSSDRLYELSLSWAPPEGRVHAEIGRLGAGPYASLGFLDGALAEFRVAGGLWLGAFGGSRPELGDLGFSTGGQKYGAFLRWARRGEPERPYAEMLLGAATERDDGGETSRDFVTLESRFGSGSRWWLSQRAEVDIHRGWREEVAGSSSQVTNAAIAGSVRLSQNLRATASYDQRRNLLTAETKPRPEEVFTRYLRQGGRLGLDWRNRTGWTAALGIGTASGDFGGTTSNAYLALSDRRAFGLPLKLGLNASGYQGEAADGWVASLRSGWDFRGGHDVELTLGASQARVGAEYDLSPRDNQWARLSGTVQLPAHLWLYGEYEVTTGDDFEGDRAFLQVGYRF